MFLLVFKVFIFLGFEKISITQDSLRLLRTVFFGLKSGNPVLNTTGLTKKHGILDKPKT